eukprot:gnl/MRDRNA2_/MRDRNA2_225208_c0_seq1.p1 gnl/MRDRNA2_/MRDRNA2_225208_c0~~gnl/MRDRNA2_/MRDRNA2_225208_c0_seq1.p1  ORF type:complete len:139 (-),score=19.70 gnl/MRDRNA2_/MRDRNA2_225208_c0_seq1:86-502(-)
MKSGKSTISIPKEISGRAFMAVVNWLHTDSLRTFSSANLDDMLRAANFYQLPGMQSQLVQQVVADLNTSSIIKYLMLADALAIQSLKRSCLRYIWHNYNELMAQQAFRSLKAHPDLLIEIMSGLHGMDPSPQKRARVS